MGRHLLRLSLAALLWGCAEQQTVETSTAHSGLACVQCHQGDLPAQPERDLPLASRDGCTAAGCHSAGGPFAVDVGQGTVSFPHRDHPTPWEGTLECAACHGHPSGAAPLSASTDSCALCHSEALTGDRASDCLLCHQRPPAAAMTSQGLDIPHGGTTWLATGCVRCHFEVVDDPTVSPAPACSTCHANGPAAYGEDADPHSDHATLTCSSCHEPTLHAVLGMSTAVELQCAACHTMSHGLEAEEYPTNDVCLVCHQTDHRDQQRLFLGLMAEQAVHTPSMKFQAGLTCTSCHQTEQAESPGVHTVRGSSEGCGLCHGSPYERVLQWWQEGASERLSLATAYVAQAERSLAGPQSDSGALTAARAGLRLARDGGVQHSPENADRVIRRAVEDAGRAYEEAGRAVPPAPDLGARPRQGFCSYCHYSLSRDLDLDAMPADFHLEVMGR